MYLSNLNTGRRPQSSRRRSPQHAASILLAALFSSTAARAETVPANPPGDAPPEATPERISVGDALTQANEQRKIRPYAQIRSGEYNTVWDVQDMWAFTLGADVSPHISLELAFDTYEKNFDPWGVKQGEQSLLSLVPQVRWRLPLLNNRVVPYAVGGAGLGWYDYNDSTSEGYDWEFEAQGTTLVLSAGVGVDLFLNEHVAFNLEWKYMWLDELDVTRTPSGGGASESATFDMADFVGTFGLRAYLDNPRNLPLIDTIDHPPARLYFIGGFGAATTTDGDWIPGVKMIQESASIGSVGQSIELGFGLNIGHHLSLEFPVDYYEGVIALDNYEISPGTTVSGPVAEYATYSALPALRFRYPLYRGRFVPFLVAGAGATYAEMNDRNGNLPTVDVEAKGVSLSASVGGGVDYFLNPDVCLFGQVKYVHSFDQDIEINGNSGSGDLAWLHLQLGFRINLARFGKY